MEIHTLDAKHLAALIGDRFDCCRERPEPPLVESFRSILFAANDYVPSECGSVALGDPSGEQTELVFVASFGRRSEKIPGTRFPSHLGISGRVYRTGQPCLRNDVQSDQSFYAGVDEKTNFVTRSIMSVPITLSGRVCGVLSLLNRLHPRGFRKRDLRLMEIFCRFLSTSIREVVDFHFQQELAQRDHLTGLYNDRMFYELLLQEMRFAQEMKGELALIFLDLDHFKGVVDKHGHLVGSRVLGEVGRLLARVVTHPGAVLSRYGGDEYVVVLPGHDRQKAIDVAERIRVAVADHTYLCEQLDDGSPALHLKGHFTASLGVAVLSDSAVQEDILARRHQFIRQADEAMYAAKAAGKNRVFTAGSVVAPRL